MKEGEGTVGEREKKEVIKLFCFLSVRAQLALKFCVLDGYVLSGSQQKHLAICGDVASCLKIRGTVLPAFVG